MIAACWQSVACSRVAHAQSMLELASGEVLPADEIRLEPNWKLHASAPGAPRSFTQWFAWGAFRPRASGAHVLLTDGSQVVGQVLAIAEPAVVVDCQVMGRLDIPMEFVQAVVFQPPRPWRARDELWDELYRRGRADSEEVWLSNGDRLEGEVLLSDKVPARLPLFLDSIRIRWRTTGDIIEMPVPRITAIRFRRRNRESDASRDWGVVAWQDGTCLHASDALANERRTAITLVCGWQLNWPADGASARLAYVRSPPKYWRHVGRWQVGEPVHVPVLSRPLPPRFNRNVIGGRLRVAATEFFSGVGALGRARIVFDVPPQAAAVATRVGIDQAAREISVRPFASVRFRIYGQQEDGTWRLLIESPRMTADDRAVRLAVSTSGLSRVALITDAADHGETLDYADWVDTRFYFPNP